MLSRYAHIPAQAKRAVIASLEIVAEHPKSTDFRSDSPQNPPQSEDVALEQSLAGVRKFLN
jgi:hypothetical protein